MGRIGDPIPRRSRILETVPLLNAFTVDVEDYYHVSAFERNIDRGDWERYDSRVADNTLRILDLLDRHEHQGHFLRAGLDCPALARAWSAKSIAADTRSARTAIGTA